MKVLLTGGTGYVGHKLREDLVAAGHEVRLLVRAESQRAIFNADRYEILRGNVFNTNACLRACVGADAVINLIGIIREHPGRGETFDQYHRAATQNLVDAARREGVKRFIQMSALGVRPDARSEYHRTKLAGERVVQESPMQWTIFRPSWIFGPGDNLTLQILDLIDQPVVPMIDAGRYKLQPVSLEDVSATFTRSLSMPDTQRRTFELGGPERLTFAEIVEKFSSFLGRNVRTMNVPAWSIRPVVKVMQRFAFFPLTADQLRMLAEDNVCEIDPWVRTFGLQPQSFVQAIPVLAQRTASAA